MGGWRVAVTKTSQAELISGGGDWELPLVHFPAGREHFLWNTLGGTQFQ
jgi:hypothetical protein